MVQLSEIHVVFISWASQVGMFFALGHSSVVFLACCGIILAQHFMNDHMGLFHRYGSVIGSSVSGTFLLIIGVLNLYTARQLWKVWRGGTAENQNHEEIMGFCLRCCPRLFRGVSKPWHMLLVGFVFGLGFDTSTEVGLLGIVAWTAKLIGDGSNVETWRTTDFGVYFYMLSINRLITEEHNFDPYPCDRFCWTQHVFFFVFNCITRLKVCNSFPCGFKIFLKVAGFPLREALIWYCLLIRLFLLLLWADPLHFFLFASSNGPKTEPLTYDLASRVLSHFKSVSRQCQGHSVCVFWIRTDFLDLFRIHSDYSAFALLESFCLYLLSSWKPTLSEPTYKGKNNLKKIGKKQENANIGEKLVVRNKSESKFLALRGAAFWMKLPLLLGSSLKSKDE